MKSFRRVIAAGASALLASSLLLAFEAPEPAQALNPNDFDPGLIISDAQFYNSRAMTEAQIQKFLDDQVGTCENS
ncbi:MAG: hypothetical protein ACXIUP_04560, partial [Microcella sp.]